METALKSTAAATTWTVSPVGAVKTRLQQYRVYRDTVTELNALSDRALADLGLSRNMIRAVAREAAYNG